MGFPGRVGKRGGALAAIEQATLAAEPTDVSAEAFELSGTAATGRGSHNIVEGTQKLYLQTAAKVVCAIRVTEPLHFNHVSIKIPISQGVGEYFYTAHFYLCHL